jgi:hypothetical protein
VGGREAAIEFTRLAAMSGDEHLKEMLHLYEELTPHQQKEPNLLEQLCLSVGLHPSDYFGRVAASAYRRNYDVAAFAAAALAAEAIGHAKRAMAKESGFKDRQMILQAAGHLERAPMVQVNTGSQDNRQINIQQGPSFEQLTAKVSELLRGESAPKQLTEGEIIDATPE